VSQNLTALFGGSVDNYRVVLYDWTTMTSSIQLVRLNSARVGSSCAVFKDKEPIQLIPISAVNFFLFLKSCTEFD
jgi:hypothetical protein